MAQEKLFYEYKLDSDTTTQSGTLPFINDIFLDIINYDEVNPYYFNSGYRENLDHVEEERSQKARFGLKKMQPYTKVKLFQWSKENDPNYDNQTLVEFSEQNYEVTDCVFVDGERYIMVVSEDRTKMWIFKQIHVTEIDTCVNNGYESGFLGHFVNISKYDWYDEDHAMHTQYYYPFSKCLCDKFTVAAWGKGKKISTGTDGIMKVELIGNDLVYYFYDRSGNPLNAAAGDYLYINGGPLSGQIVPLGGETSVDGYSNAMLTPFAWTGVNLTEGANEAWSDPHERVIYQGYGDIIHFCTRDGILHLNYSYEHPTQTETTLCGSMYTNTANGQFLPNFVLSSMIYHKPIDSIVLYDVADGDVTIGLNGYLKFYFIGTNKFFVSNEFTDLVEFQDYVIMMGPSKTGLAYINIDPAGSGVVSNYYREIGGGYLNRGSWVSDGNTFIMANEKGVWALNVVAYYGSSSSYYAGGANRFPIAADWEFQVGPFITDISQFNRYQGDHLGMSMKDKQFKMYISNEAGTIIWIKSIEHNYWRQHILTPYKDADGNEVTPIIKGFAGDLYIGNGIYERGGDQDIKTYLSFMFGDQTLMTPKMVHTLKLALGRDSWITKNTVLEVTYTLGGKTYTTRYSDWSSSLWVKEMMEIKQTGNEDQHMKTYQNEIEMSSGDGNGKINPKLLYTYNRIKAFENYNPQGNHISDFADDYELGNWGTLHADLGYMFDTVTFKLITYGKDCLEFYGALMWYQLTNETGGNIDNSLVIYNRDLPDNTGQNID